MKNKKFKVRKILATPKSGKAKWKKNLYENTDYPDNYTDESFLEELQKNVYFHDISISGAIISAGCVTQEFTVVVFFVLVFTYLYNGWIEPETIFVQSSLLTVVGYLLFVTVFTNSKSYVNTISNDIKTVGMFFIFGYILSPILKTLTDTISTDTIYAMSCFMMMVHLVFFDYGVAAAIVSSALSLNAALFGSVCLASRLSSPFHAFVLLTNAVECFTLLPVLLAFWRDSVILSISMVLCSALVLYKLSFTLTVVFICIVIFINVICPILFVKYQNYKDNIYGPWDEAIIQETDV